MTKEKQLAELQMCVLMRNGIEVWINADQGKQLGKDWANERSGVILIGGNYLNGVDIMGIFTPQALEDYHRRKRGMWTCKYNNWHEKNDICACWQQVRQEWVPPIDEEITEEQRQKNLELLREAKAKLTNKLGGKNE